METPTYGTALLKGDRWVLCDVQPHVAMKLKVIFPRIPKTSVGPFEIPNDLAHAADLEWFMDRYPMKLDQQDRHILEVGKQAFWDSRAQVEQILKFGHVPTEYAGIREGQNLRGYQAQIVETLSRVHGLLCGDEVGLGKTYTAAAACLLDGALPAGIVCQPHLQQQWASVIREFTTLTVHTIKKSKPYPLPKADVYIFRSSQVLGWIDYFHNQLKFGLVAIDEIQDFRRGVESGKGMALWHMTQNAKYRLGLSATPIYNYGQEIWHVMRFLRPEVLGSIEEFSREWCSGYYENKTVKDPKALGSFLREQHAFVRRTKAEVGKEMPQVNKIIETIDYDHAEVKSIEDLARKLAIKATTGSFVERGQAARELDLLARHHTGVAKAKDVARFARMIVESGEPIILAGWHRDVYDIWLEELASLKPAMYTGTESPTQKEEAKRRFLSGETDVLIMSLRSGAGLDGLQYRCSTVLVGELDWSPGVHHQLIGRLDREGQTLPVTAIFLVVNEGSDPPMMEMLGLKASQASNIVDPLLGVQTVRSDRSPLQMLVQRYLKGVQHAS